MQIPDNFCRILEPDNPDFNERFACSDCGENFITLCDAARLKQTIAELRAEVERIEFELRKMMWLTHGHWGIYGDDGEMQCIKCLPFRCTDYKRAPIEDVRRAYNLALLERASIAFHASSTKGEDNAGTK